MDRKRMFLLLTALHLLSFAALSAWVLLLIVAMLNGTVNEVASRIALPALLSSMACMAIFKRLAQRAKLRLG